MVIKLKNKFIFFSIENIWLYMDYKFKFMLNDLISKNTDDEFEQVINVPEDILILIFKSVSGQPEGVAAIINKDMLSILIPQISILSNMTDVLSGIAEPNEASRILIGIDNFDKSNKATKLAKIINGKNLILT